MADDKQQPAPAQSPAPTPAAGAAPAPAQPGAAAGTEEERPDWASRAGTIVMVGAIGFLVVVLIDVAVKGRLLGPLLARFATPRQEAQDGTPHAGD